MKIDDALRPVTRLFLDMSPVVYYVERNANYIDRADEVFNRVVAGSIQAVTSPVTLAECLVTPIRLGLTKLKRDFADLIVAGAHVTFWRLDEAVAEKAAELRGQYNLTLTDAFQVAVALTAGCEALLTNDQGLKRIQALPILVLDELELYCRFRGSRSHVRQARAT